MTLGLDRWSSLHNRTNDRHWHLSKQLNAEPRSFIVQVFWGF
ncbi:hypothetical protein ACLKA7_007628, partial [Drosophila subpalustris]